MIPKAQFVGVYFKSSTDGDLIAWKEQQKESGETRVSDFVKQAIREKLSQRQNQEQLEHPTIILRRVESTLLKLASHFQQLLDGESLFVSPKQQQQQQRTTPAMVMSADSLDAQCADAGWD